MKVVRSAKSGKFVKKSAAKKRPGSTVTETIKRVKKTPEDKKRETDKKLWIKSLELSVIDWKNVIKSREADIVNAKRNIDLLNLRIEKQKA